LNLKRDGKLAKDDIDGWLDLADEMTRLLGPDSVARAYLRRALKNNPGDERLPEEAKRSRAAAERIARKGGKVKTFIRSLQSIVSRAAAARRRRVEKIEAERAFEAWQAKVRELEQQAT